MTDEHAVFVAPGGNDDDAGTAGAPVATLTKAIEVAAGDKIVIVCNAEYDEHVVVSAVVRAYGGFGCAGGDWAVEAGTPLFKPTTVGPALRIDGVDAEVVIEDVAFQATDAMGLGESSVAGLIANSTNVLLRRVRLEAGLGMDGLNGTLTPFTYPSPSELDGNDADVTEGGLEKLCQCPSDTQTSGGLGGDAAITGQPGGSGSPDHPGPGGEGGTPGGSCVEGVGRNGADAPARPAAAGAATRGTLSPIGWVPTNGTDGTTGSPGQGGGGGASSTTGGGGGGGCGGCGGAGGKAGTGGGSSIALAVFQGVLTIENSELVAKNAGKGGNGVAGQPGQMERGFSGIQGPGGACPGGSGGFGGDGGAGGGGAGGISAGVVWKGEAAPTVTNPMFTLGDAGIAGEGGAGTNDGVAGLAQDVIEIP